MRCHLCISVTLLTPLFHGKGDPDANHVEGCPEWPPSPMRLFQALVAGTLAGCRKNGWPDARKEALEWLEQQKPPCIVSPNVRRAPAYTLFVPNNDGDRAFDRQERLTSKVAHPHHLCDGDTLYYVWPINENGEPSARGHAETLCKMARHMLAVGWGIDQVAGNGRILSQDEVDGLPGRRWLADAVYRPREPRRRVPQSGSLDDLRKVHESFLNRVTGKRLNRRRKLRQYYSVTYRSASTLPRRSYAVFELPEGVAFRQPDTVRAAAMLRSLTCRCAEADTHVFTGGSEAYVAGHVEQNGATPPRFSYLPVPTVGHEYADGLVRRLMIAEPFGDDGRHARWAQNRLRGQTLTDSDGNERGILLNLWRRSSEGVVERFVGEKREWASVTPVVLPGFDDGKHAKAEKLFLAAVQQAGIPIEAIEEFTLRKAPFWLGSQHPRNYKRPDYLDEGRNRRFPAWHLHMVFREAVCGPISIGAGRHCGLGLFAAIKD